MRKTVTSIISATALLGASSLALAASPSASDQSQLNSGTTSSRTGSQAAPYSNSGSGTSTSRDTLNSGDASGMTRGSGTSAQVNDQAQVKERLEQQGYTDVQNVRKDRTGWTAKAKKGGRQVTVNLDNSGQVKTR